MTTPSLIQPRVKWKCARTPLMAGGFVLDVSVTMRGTLKNRSAGARWPGRYLHQRQDGVVPPRSAKLTW